MPVISDEDLKALSDCMEDVLGHQLSSVEFVQDYLQLRFDGPCLTATTWPTVIRGSSVLSQGDPGFKDTLCGQITQEVVNVAVRHSGLELRFRNETVIRISLLDEDYRGPEALSFTGEDGRWIAV